MKLQKSSGQLRKLRLELPILFRRVRGHSMVPILPPGTLVIGLRYFRSLRPGQVVVIQHDNREKVKRIDQIKGNQVFVTGDHPETSTDSRHFGWLPVDYVQARIIWPRTSPQ